MLWKSFKDDGFIERAEKDGSMGEYAMVMDNCGGQNKNQMIIWFLMLMIKIRVFKKASNIYLVCDHTKNACDRIFMLLKQHLHHKNYTQWDNSIKKINNNDSVNAMK